MDDKKYELFIKLQYYLHALDQDLSNTNVYKGLGLSDFQIYQAQKMYEVVQKSSQPLISFSRSQFINILGISDLEYKSYLEHRDSDGSNYNNFDYIFVYLMTLLICYYDNQIHLDNKFFHRLGFLGLQKKYLSYGEVDDFILRFNKNGQNHTITKHIQAIKDFKIY